MKIPHRLTQLYDDDLLGELVYLVEHDAERKVLLYCSGMMEWELDELLQGIASPEPGEKLIDVRSTPDMPMPEELARRCEEATARARAKRKAESAANRPGQGNPRRLRYAERRGRIGARRYK